MDAAVGTGPATTERRAADRLRYARRAIRRRARIDITVTDPPDDALVDWDVAVAMRDGVRLKVNVFRPDDDREHPVLVCLHPYGKDQLPRRRRVGSGYHPAFQYHLMQSEPLTMSAWTTWEAADPAYWVGRGYVVVNADMRGFGAAEGIGELLTEQGGVDGHDLIEWAAAQPWSNGRVGMTGVSYLAMSQWATASTRPPHLAAICPWEGFTDLYRDFARPGGVRENGFMFIWNTGFKVSGHPIDIGRQVQDRPLDDEWYAARNSPLEQIDVPALICGSFSDHNLHTRGSFEGFRRIGSTQKWLYTHRGQKWATYYSAEGLEVQARFFDHFLRGDDTGLDEARPVRIEVREDADTVTDVRHTSEWPPADTRWQDLHLSAGPDATTGTLTTTPPTTTAVWSFDIADGHLTFTHRFADDTELVGPMSLVVELDVDGADDVALFAGVRKFRDGREVGFNGSYGFPADLVTHGMLLASHRAVDTQRSLPYLPYHPHARRDPLLPGRPVRLQLGLQPSATLFRAGEELRLDLRGQWFFSRNPLIGQFPPAYDVTPRHGTCRVRSGTLVVPVAPTGVPPMPGATSA